MKKISFFLFTLMVVCAGCYKKTQPEIKTVTEQTAGKTRNNGTLASSEVTFTIEGMTCAVGCAATIEKKLANLEGVSAAKVNFESKQAMVTFDPSRLQLQDIAFAVTSAGDGETYQVMNMKEAKEGSASHQCNTAGSGKMCCSGEKKTE